MTDFEEFFHASYERVRRGLALVAGVDAANDATQVAFSRAFASWGRVGAMERPTGWVYVVGLNEVRAQARRAKREAMTLASLVASSDGTAVDAAIVADVQAAALAALSPRERTAVFLRFYADLDVRAVADLMRCREGTVKATLNHARAKLRPLLAESTGTEER